MKVGVSSQADLMGELAEFASHPLWRNIIEELEVYCTDLKSFAANSIISDFAYNKGIFHGSLGTIQFLHSILAKYRG